MNKESQPPFEVVCINKDGWIGKNGIYEDNPKYGEICTVVELVKEDGLAGYVLKEYMSVEDSYLASQFVPTIRNKEDVYGSVAEEILSLYPIREEIETDLPIKEVVNN